jgi:hypothetical protein
LTCRLRHALRATGGHDEVGRCDNGTPRIAKGTHDMRTLLLVGFTLVTISAPPLALWAREMAIGSGVNARYSVERIARSSEPDIVDSALRSVIGGHTVELVDDQPFKAREPFTAGDVRAEGLVRVLVDGRVHSAPVRGTIRLESRDANRYWGFAYLMRLVDRQGTDRLVVAENLGSGRYRTISVFPDGRVVEDQFDYASRCTPPVRAVLIRAVVPHPSGFCSDVMQVWPTLWYPVLYPWVSGILGGLFSIVGLLRHWTGRRATTQGLDA